MPQLTSRGALLAKPKYPQFRNPEKYMRCRVSRTPLGVAKTRMEERALERCLKNATGVRTVCDVPSGPGRLFSFWKNKDFRVLGVDFSAPMVEAAAEAHRSLGLEGEVREGDAFRLKETLIETPDLVACVRFAYYFDANKRVRLLRSLASASRRYVLVQYKTAETIKGQKNLIQSLEGRRRDKSHQSKRFCSYPEIVDEVVRAGLVPVCIEPVGHFSDRVFVLAEKPRGDLRTGASRLRPRIRAAIPRRYLFLAVLLVLFALVYGQNATERSFWSEDEAYCALGARSALDGHWLMPRIGPDRPADKPPFVFWWVAAVSAVAGDGVSEWTARLANLLPALGALASVFFLAQRWFNPWSALLATIVLATSYEFWEVATGVGRDTLTVLFLTLAWGAAFDAMRSKRFHRSRWLLLWGALSLAVMARGPAAFSLAAFAIVVFAAFRFGPRGLASGAMRTRPLTGALVALAPFAAWMAMVRAREGQAPWNALRLMDLPIHAKSWHYMLREFPSILLPWSLLLPFVAWDLYRRLRPAADGETGERSARHGATAAALSWNEPTVFSLCAIGATIVFFSLLPSKRDYYLLPLMPWCAVLIGDWLWRWLCRLAPVEVEESCGASQFGGMMLGMRSGRVLAAVVFLLLLSMAVYSGVVTEFLDPGKSARTLASAADEAVDADDRLTIVDGEDPRVMFYLSEKFDLSDDDAPGLARLRERLVSEREVELMVKASDLKHFIDMEDVGLFVSGVADFRDKRFYFLTNEPGEGQRPLRGIRINRISGICHHSRRGTLFAVGGNGQIAETDLDGRILKKSQLEADCEAVAADPVSGRLLVSDPKHDRILEIDPDTLTVASTYAVVETNAAFRDTGEKKGRIDGMAFVNAGGANRLFALREGDSPWLVEVRLGAGPDGKGQAEILPLCDVGRYRLDEVLTSADGASLLGFSERDCRLVALTPDGVATRQWQIPGDDVEAVTFDSSGALYVCEECKLLTVFAPADVATLEKR